MKALQQLLLTKSTLADFACCHNGNPMWLKSGRGSAARFVKRLEEVLYQGAGSKVKYCRSLNAYSASKQVLIHRWWRRKSTRTQAPSSSDWITFLARNFHCEANNKLRNHRQGRAQPGCLNKRLTSMVSLQALLSSFPQSFVAANPGQQQQQQHSAAAASASSALAETRLSA